MYCLTKKKHQVIFSSFLVIGFITLIIIVNYITKDKHPVWDLSNEFYTSDIIGRIEKTSIWHRGTGFKIINNDNRFLFYPYTSELNNKNKFRYFAATGDSIYKPALSDTLKLFKNGKIYRYTFRKYDSLGKIIRE